MLALVVAAAATLAYGGTLAHGFVWDDPMLIRDRIHLYTWRGLPSLLGSDFFGGTTQATHYYRPAVTLTFFLDLTLWGLHPFGFHLTNVLGHALTSVCVFWLARRVTREDAVAVAAGAVFAVHPVHSGSVAFVAGRTDVLATLFALAALLAHARWRESGQAWWRLVSLAAFALAVLSKEAAVVVPALLVLWDRLVERDLRGRRAFGVAAARYAPYGAVLTGYALARHLALGQLVEFVPSPWADGVSRVVTGLGIAVRYARIALVPYPENLYYSIPVDSPPLAPMWWLAMLILVGLLALAVVAAARWPVAGFGALWFWIALVPPVGVNLLPVSTAHHGRALPLPPLGWLEPARRPRPRAALRGRPVGAGRPAAGRARERRRAGAPRPVRGNPVAERGLEGRVPLEHAPGRDLARGPAAPLQPRAHVPPPGQRGPLPHPSPGRGRAEPRKRVDPGEPRLRGNAPRRDGRGAPARHAGCRPGAE